MTKDITGYEVTEDGKVYSCSSNWRGYGKRELKQDLNDDGYPSVRVSINGKRTRYSVHGLVANKFLPPKDHPDLEIRHLNGNKLGASAKNLKWGTQKENAADREIHGRTSKGDSHSHAIKKGKAIAKEKRKIK